MLEKNEIFLEQPSEKKTNLFRASMVEKKISREQVVEKKTDTSRARDQTKLILLMYDKTNTS